ncbi:RING-H2 finger protein ATL56-like [Senna tora]|uniref:RING-H2 finger protein ATL56-like n=1 Tax=Senna tora TaxID=362788 RepID=A0A834T016_9FABA|nr:RING-H2 finger protein ATL56-like [Senna tora]
MPPPSIPNHASASLQSHPKPSPKLLSLVLKAIIMTLLTSIFFLFLGFAAFVLLHLCFIGGVIHRLRSRPTIQHGPSSAGIAPRDVKKLPQFRVSAATEPGSETQCVVCLDGFRNGHWCRKLAGCGHVFHRRCVDMWLVKVAACPTCRTPVRINAGGLGRRPPRPNPIRGPSRLARVTRGRRIPPAHQSPLRRPLLPPLPHHRRSRRPRHRALLQRQGPHPAIRRRRPQAHLEAPFHHHHLHLRHPPRLRSLASHIARPRALAGIEVPRALDRVGNRGLPDGGAERGPGGVDRGGEIRMGGDSGRVGLDGGEEVLRVGLVGSVRDGFGFDPMEDGGVDGRSDFAIGDAEGDGIGG